MWLINHNYPLIVNVNTKLQFALILRAIVNNEDLWALKKLSTRVRKKRRTTHKDGLIKTDYA